jgi:large subunit ribosomal protein L15
MITLNKLPKTYLTRTQRVGRGNGSGRGKNSGKGHKGQTKHGGKVPIHFEGGMKTIMRRTPKSRGFSIRENYKKESLTLAIINRNFVDGDIVSLETLKEKDLVNKTAKNVRIINSGELSVKVTFDTDNGIYLTKGVKSVTSK